jgi:hypothetical protein
MSGHAGNVVIREAHTIWRQQGGWFDARWHTGEVDLNLSTDLAAELILIDVPLDFEPVGVWAGER